LKLGLKTQALVLDFYNQRQKASHASASQIKHMRLVAELQKQYDVYVITQNIDNLHERAGSKKVLHLHGEIMKARSTVNSELIYPLNDWEIKLGDCCERGSQLRPHIVWFGEAVPEMDNAIKIAQTADIFITIGTSLNVYPAANLIHEVSNNIPKYLIDPGDFNLSYIKNLKHIKTAAVEGMRILSKQLNEKTNE
jgi:NAD-dependent deacetylase